MRAFVALLIALNSTLFPLRRAAEPRSASNRFSGEAQEKREQHMYIGIGGLILLIILLIILF
jgi:dolichol kinase